MTAETLRQRARTRKHWLSPPTWNFNCIEERREPKRRSYEVQLEKSEEKQAAHVNKVEINFPNERQGSKIESKSRQERQKEDLGKRIGRGEKSRTPA